MFHIFTICRHKPNLFFEVFKAGIIGLKKKAKYNNGVMFVVAICNNLMLTESSILFSN